MTKPDLTTSQAAKRINATPAAVRALIDAGELPNAYKHGRTWRIPQSDIDAWLGKQTTPTLLAPTRWEQFKSQPYIFWPSLIIGSLTAMTLFLFALIGASADLGPATDAAKQIGFLPTLTPTPTSTATPTATPTPSPTATPLPFQPETKGYW